jgi:hypothetical protein
MRIADALWEGIRAEGFSVLLPRSLAGSHGSHFQAHAGRPLNSLKRPQIKRKNLHRADWDFLLAAAAAQNKSYPRLANGQDV